MSTAVIPAEPLDANIALHVLARGDLSKMSDEQKLSYYNAVCRSLDLNPLTRPFEFIVLDKQLRLYARKDCTEQLRSKREISIEIVSRETRRQCYIVTARAKLPGGRTDESEGVVPLVKENGEWLQNANGKNYFKGDGTFVDLAGEALANAYMKAETKAKRRVTLSICGLGFLDESELETIPAASVRPAAAPALTNEPPPGQRFLEAMRGWEKKRVAAGLCMPGDWLAYLLREGAEAGYHMEDLTAWPSFNPEGHAEFASLTLKRFDNECKAAQSVATA